MIAGTNNQKDLALEIKVSMYTAFIGGILTPLLETIRRWHQISDPRYFISWFDDYLIGGILFFAASKTFKLLAKGVKYLIAAWGIATGMIFNSFFGQLQAINQSDPAPVSSLTVVIIKGIMFLICICSLILSLKTSSLEAKQ